VSDGRSPRSNQMEIVKDKYTWRGAPATFPPPKKPPREWTNQSSSKMFVAPSEKRM